MNLIAHRGSLETPYKLNTKEALLYALNINYIAGIEFDIRMTKDKKLVIIHDPIINLVSDGSGIVNKMTYRKMLKYNFGTKEKSQKISLLSSFLKEVNTDKILLIELKEEKKDFEIFAKTVLKVLEQFNYLNFYICSFNYELLLYFKKNTNYKCGLIIGLGQNTNRLYNHFDINVITYNYRDRISKKKKTFLWTINHKKEDINNYYIITDYPSRFIS